MISAFMYGRISKDIEMQYPGETTIAVFDVAVNKRGKDVEYFRCKAFNRIAKVIEEYFHKGSRIALQATPTQPKKYENKDGKTVYPNVEFIVNSIDFVDTKAESSEHAPSQSETSTDDSFMSVDNAINDELPFR